MTRELSNSGYLLEISESTGVFLRDLYHHFDDSRHPILVGEDLIEAHRRAATIALVDALCALYQESHEGWSV